MSDILKRVRKIVVKNLNVEENKIILDANFANDLGADSIDVVELVMALEEEFNINIPDAEAEKIVTVKDIINYINVHKKD